MAGINHGEKGDRKMENGIMSEYTFLARYAEPVDVLLDSNARTYYLSGDDAASVAKARTAMERLGFSVAAKQYPNQHVVHVASAPQDVKFFSDWCVRNLNPEVLAIGKKLAAIGYPPQMTTIAVGKIINAIYGGH